jgi:GH24 family phage-related lysozyme (muramidase)
MSKPRSLIVIATGVSLALAPLGFELSKRKTAEAEGLVERSYMDVGQYETIGYGQRLYGECDNLKPEECVLPEPQADFALQLKIYKMHKQLYEVVKVPLNEGQR